MNQFRLTPMYYSIKLSFYWRNMSILHNSAAEGFDNMYALAGGWSILDNINNASIWKFWFYVCHFVKFWQIMSTFLYCFYSLVYYNQSHLSVPLSVYLNVRQPVNCLRCLLLYIFVIYCSCLAQLLKLVCRWQQSFRLLLWPWFQGSRSNIIYIYLWLGQRKFLSFFSDGVNILHNDSLCSVNFRAPIWSWSQRSRSNIPKICSTACKPLL